MITPHDPYGPIFAELCDINDAHDDDLVRESLRLTQPYVRRLRIAYRESPSNVDYSCPHNRAAYLLAYYPHHIEVLYHILADLPPAIAENLFSQPRLRACFLGAGPAPEALGWISYLATHTPTAEHATAYLFDKHTAGWGVGREITRYHLAPLYWPNGTLVTRAIECDLLDVEASWDGMMERAVGTSSLFVMQNCLNDLVGALDHLLNNLLWLFERTVPGSALVVADLCFPNVLNAMRRIEATIQDTGLGVSLRGADEGVTEFESQIDMHPIVAEQLFTGEDSLVYRKRTRFYSLVLARAENS